MNQGRSPKAVSTCLQQEVELYSGVSGPLGFRNLGVYNIRLSGFRV